MKIDRQKVKDKCNGHCGYCGCVLEDKWQVDHMTPKYHWEWINSLKGKDMNHIDNLMPACISCNHYKRALPVDATNEMNGYRGYMRTFHLRLKKLPKNTQIEKTRKRMQYMQTIAGKYGITVDKPWVGVFYYETLQSIEETQQ